MLVASRFLQGMGEAIATPAPSAWWRCCSPIQGAGHRHRDNGGVAGLGGALGPGDLRTADLGRLVAVDLLRKHPVAVIAILAVSRLVAESRASSRLAFGRGAAERGESADLAGPYWHGRLGCHRLRVHCCRQPFVGRGPGLGCLDRRAVAAVAFVVRERTAWHRWCLPFSPQPGPSDLKRLCGPVRQRVLHRVLPANPVLPAVETLLGHPDRPGLPTLRHCDQRRDRLATSSPPRSGEAAVLRRRSVVRGRVLLRPGSRCTARIGRTPSPPWWLWHSGRVSTSPPSASFCPPSVGRGRQLGVGHPKHGPSSWVGRFGLAVLATLLSAMPTRPWPRRCSLRCVHHRRSPGLPGRAGVALAGALLVALVRFGRRAARRSGGGRERTRAGSV